MKNMEKYLNPEIVRDFRKCSDRRRVRIVEAEGYLEKGIATLSNVGDMAFVTGKTLVYSICCGSR